jgi:hypothetical protein
MPLKANPISRGADMAKLLRDYGSSAPYAASTTNRQHKTTSPDRLMHAG